MHNVSQSYRSPPFARSDRARRMWVGYLYLTVAFWAALLLVWDGTGTAGNRSVHLGWAALVVNGVTLLGAIRGLQAAFILLIMQTVVLAGVCLSLGVPPVGTTFGGLGVIAAIQSVLLGLIALS